MNDYEKVFLDEEINYLKDAEQSRDEQRFQDSEIKDLQCKNTVLKDSNMQLKHDIMGQKDEYEIKIRHFEDELRLLYNEIKNLKNEKIVLKHVDSTIPHPQQILQCGQDNQKVLLRDFNFVKNLGEGGFGKVVLATGSLPGEKLYAIKAMNKRRMTSSAISRIFAEREALMSTSLHPFVTMLYSCFQNKDHLFFVMEYMSGGDLGDELSKVEVFCQKRVQFYAAEIALGLQCLHQCGMLHRDLKLANVLVGRDGHCKISDFGLSKMGFFKHDRASGHCGTPLCMVPEMVMGLPYGHAVVWWALGIMVYEMFMGCPPFDFDDYKGDYDEEEKKLFSNILNSDVDYPDDMSLAAVSLVMKFDAVVN